MAIQFPSAGRLPVDAILAAAQQEPTAEAVRHKRRGLWLSWSRAALAADSAALAEVLAARGIGPGAIVAVSGDYTPNLLLFALAAARRGAAIVPLPPKLARATLAAWLRDHPVDLAFLGQREQLGAWRAAQRDAARAGQIVVDFHLPWGHPRADGVIAFADLLPGAVRPNGAGRPSPQVVWLEEGTEWPDGLACAMHALAAGRVLAAPESRIAAAGDRRETQPTGFLISAAHRVVLARDLASRLPTGDGLTARLTRLALRPETGSASAPWHRSWLLGRLRRPFGFARLRELTVIGDAPATGEDVIEALGIRASHAAPPSDGVGRDVPTDLVFA
jgi:hypothetical protein